MPASVLAAWSNDDVRSPVKVPPGGNGGMETSPPTICPEKTPVWQSSLPTTMASSERKPTALLFKVPPLTLKNSPLCPSSGCDASPTTSAPTYCSAKGV